jgi:outer membrane protein TolC
MGNIVKAREDLQKSAIKLSLYRWRDDGSPDLLPLPEEAPDSFPPPNRLPDFVVNEGITRAIDRSPDLRRIDFDRRQSGLDAQLAANDRRPRLDLYLAPGYDTGFNGTGPTFKFGATIELPLRTRAADGRFTQAQLKLQKAELNRRLEEGNIVARVREAATAVNAAHDRYLLALQELNLTRDLERGERTRFAAGDSTLFLVNQRERAAAEAEIKLIDILAAYEQALVNFRIAVLEY